MGPAIPPELPGTVDPVLLIECIILLALVCVGLICLVFNRHRAFKAMRDAERSFRELYDNISEGVFRSTLGGRMISANPSLVRLNGYETEEQMIHSVNDIASEWYVDPNRRAEIHEMLLEHGQVSGIVSEVYRHNTRERIWVEENIRLVRDKKTGKPLYYDGTVREVTDTIRRLQLQERHEKIASMVSGCLYQYRERPDGSSSMPYASVGLFNIFEVRPEEVAEDDAPMIAVTHPEDAPSVRAAIEHSRDTLTPWQCEFRIRTRSGREKWVLGHAAPEREADGSTLWHGFFTDVSERKRSEARIYDLAYFDTLTGLPNRATLLDRLEQALLMSADNGQWGALFFIDLDQFKVLNDTKGHHVGDRLLFEVASRLKSNAADKLVARLGGDEFVVLMQNLGFDERLAADRAAVFGKDIIAVMADPFLLEGIPFRTTASVGVALFQGEALGVDELLKGADLAMYEAKAEGRGAVRFFVPEMQRVLEERLALTTELRDALDRGGLELLYQPQVEADGAWIGAEALLRWNHPQRGQLAPGVFLPLAERGGLSVLIDAFVIGTACATLRQWQGDLATRNLQLAVNISAHQLNAELVASVRECIAQAGIDPSLLAVEITEHVMLDDKSAATEAMVLLRELGVKFALDDFGTGYSSLAYLKRLPIDTLKIDGSFIGDLESDPGDRAIVQTILSIARALDVSVIAEGVETPMQALLLRQFGCHVFQGYLFGRPMPLAEFTERARSAVVGNSAEQSKLTA